MVPLQNILSSRWILAVYFTLVAGVNVCSAQYGGMPYDAAAIVNTSDAYHPQQFDTNSPPDSGNYGVYQSVAKDSVDELYRSNATRPLGGLFAKGFTRTLTVLGGVNYLNSLNSNDIAINPEVEAFLPDSLFERPDSGYAISFAFGRRHSHKLRSEIELAIRENDLASSGSVDVNDPINDVITLISPSTSDEDDKITTYSVMKNFIRDFKNRSRFTPYVGAGLGWSYLDVEAPSLGVDGGVGAFTYQAIGGVSTTVNKAVDLVVEYRFLGTSEIELDEFGAEVAYEAHNIFLGLKFEY